MREAQTKTIGSTAYTVNQLGPTKALDLLVDIVKILGPGIAGVFGDLGALKGFLDREVEDAKSDFLGKAIESLCMGLNKETLHRTCKTLADVTMIERDGKAAKLSAVYEAHFAQVGIGELLQWLAFALTAQYDDFLGALGSYVKSARPLATKKAAEKSPSLTESTG